MTRATLTLVLLALVLVDCDREKGTSTLNARQESAPQSQLLLDDLGHQRDGDIFENTFAASSECTRLRLIRLTTHQSATHRLALAEVRKAGHWVIFFACGDNECHATVQYDNGDNDKRPDDNHVDIATNETPQEVVKEVCSVVQRRNGTE